MIAFLFTTTLGKWLSSALGVLVLLGAVYGKGRLDESAYIRRHEAAMAAREAQVEIEKSAAIDAAVKASEKEHLKEAADLAARVNQFSADMAARDLASRKDQINVDSKTFNAPQDSRGCAAAFSAADVVRLRKLRSR